jgi:hypothetical protein
MLCSDGSTASSSSSEVSPARTKRARVGAFRFAGIHLHPELDRAKPRVGRGNELGGNLPVVEFSLAREPRRISCTVSHFYPTPRHILFGALGPGCGYRAPNGTRASIYARSRMPTSMRRHCLSTRRGGSISWPSPTAVCPSRAMLLSALSVSHALFGSSVHRMRSDLSD